MSDRFTTFRWLASVMILTVGFAAPWSLRCIDTYQDPVEYVYVYHPQTHWWSWSNARGFVQIPDRFNSGDTLQIYRLGYQPQSILLPDQKSVSIILIPEPLELAPISRTETRQSPLSAARSGFEVYPQIRSHTVTRRWVFETLPGIQLRTYGGPASVATLTANGGPATHTHLKIDDFDITNAQTGALDVSQLPLPLIARASFIPNGQQSHSDAGDGTIRLDPWKNGSMIYTGTGAFGHREFFTRTQLNIGHHKHRFLIGRRIDKGNYPVSWRDQTFTRKNNDFKQSYFAWQNRRIWSPGWYTNSLLLITVQNRGVAGLVYSPSRARRDDQLSLAGLTLGRVYRRGIDRLQITVIRNLDAFQDPDLAINSHHDNRSLAIRLFSTWKWKPWLEFQPDVLYRMEEVNSTELEPIGRTANRESMSFYIRGPRGIRMTPQITRYSYNNHLAETTGQLTLGWEPDDIPWLKNLELSHGRYVRYPTFNELYWKPGGNPNLNTEHTLGTQLTAAISPKPWMSILIQLFSKSSEDMIQWVPQGSYWAPQNVKIVDHQGGSLQTRINFPAKNLALIIQGSVVDALYHNPGDHYGKQLTYTPRLSTQFRSEWSPRNWTVAWTVNQHSEQIARYGWPDDLTLPATTLHLLSCGYQWSLPRGKLNAVIGVDNLTDVRYESVIGYPEPGRSWRLQLSFEPQFKPPISTGLNERK